jgi:hypothetical protein
MFRGLWSGYALIWFGYRLVDRSSVFLCLVSMVEFGVQWKAWISRLADEDWTYIAVVN